MSAWQVPLSVDQPKFTTPQQAQLMNLNLRQMAGQQQLQQAQIQQQNLALQNQQQAQADQQTIKQSFADNNGDYDATRKGLLGKVNTDALARFDADHLSYQQGVKALAMSDSIADREKIANTKAHSDFLGNAIDGIIKIQDPVQKQAAYLKAKADAEQAGVVAPGALPSTVPDDQTLKGLQAGTTYAATASMNAYRQAEMDRQMALGKRESVASDIAQKASERLEASSGYLPATVAPDQATGQKIVDQWYAGLPDRQKALYAPFKTYDPNTVQDNATAIRNMAMTPYQEAVTQNQATRASHMSAAMIRSQLVNDSLDGPREGESPEDAQTRNTDARQKLALLDSNKTPAAQVNQIRQEAAAKNTFNNIWDAERNQWGTKGKWDAVIADAIKANPDATSVKDPTTGKPVSITVAKTNADQAHQKAVDLFTQKDQIAQQHGWQRTPLGDTGKMWNGQTPNAVSGQASTPGPAPNSGGATKKTFSRASIPGFAAANGLSASDAESRLVRNGYTITP